MINHIVFQKSILIRMVLINRMILKKNVGKFNDFFHSTYVKKSAWNDILFPCNFGFFSLKGKRMWKSPLGAMFFS